MCGVFGIRSEERDVSRLAYFGLFALQPRGTSRVGRLFGPVTLVWFAALAALGAVGIAREPAVLAAVNPGHAARFFAENGWHGFLVLAAVFLSNLPEAAAATTGLRASGWSPARVLGLWALVALVSALASLAGYGLFDGASPEALAFVLAFAGGAILTMLADTLMPEAFEKGGPQAGLVTSVGFALAFALTTFE